MELTIKQLKQHGQIFVPQTTAEAVLVKNTENGVEKVITLDNMLERKIEQIITPAGSGLQAFKQGSNIILAHSNSVTANESPSSVKIKYDNRGHIVETVPTSDMTVVVDQEGYFQYNGSEDRNLLLGNDFGIDKDNKITLKWNYI